MTIIRSTSAEDLKRVMQETECLREVRVNMDEWVLDPQNLLLEENGNYGAFEYDKPGVFTGHYFFRIRGKEALELAKRMLKEAFEKYDVKVIVGLTPITHKGALWMNRQLGFIDQGEINTTAGPCRLVIRTAD